jgi:AcrR family transcriptional regulator
MKSAVEKKRRPGGRTARSTNAVYAAVETLLSERQPGEITMPMVAERSSMAATSLYRRWGDVRTLLLEASVAHLVLEHPLQDTGSLHGDLSAWARGVARSLADPQSAMFLRIQLGFGAAGPESLRAMAPRLLQIEEVLARGRRRGEIAPQLLQVTDHLLGPLYTRALFGAPASEAAAEGFVDDVLRLAQSASRS